MSQVDETLSAKQPLWVHPVIGAMLALGLVGWTYLSAATRVDGFSAAHAIAGAVLAPVGAFLVGRVTGSRMPLFANAAICVLVIALHAAQWSTVALRSGPGVLHYQNASAALLVQALCAAVSLAVLVNRAWLRAATALCAAALLAATILGGSRAGAALTVVPVAVAVASIRPSFRRPLVGLLAAAVTLTLVATLALGATDGARAIGQPGHPLVEASVTGRRTSLWHDAMVMIREHPLLGVGPGRFREESPTVRADNDEVRAHNGFLQVGAETGAPGAVLLLALMLWGFLCLWERAERERLAALAAAALTTLGMHASLDYVLHFPLIAAAAALVLGSATSRTAPRHT